MKKLLVQLICIGNLFTIVYSVLENATCNRNYYLNGIFREPGNRYKNPYYTEGYGTLWSSLYREFKSIGIVGNSVFEPAIYSGMPSSKCLGDIMYILQNIKSPWAMKLFDSYGKPESGILQGNFKWVGAYEECLRVFSTNPKATLGNFKGKYCMASLSFSTKHMNMPLNISTAVCLPDSCSPEELQEYIETFLNKPGILHRLNGIRSILNTFSLKCLPRERHLNNSAIAFIALLSFIFALNLAGSSITVFRYFQEVIQENKNTPIKETIVDYNGLNGDQKDISMKKENDKPPLQNVDQDSKSIGLLDKYESFLKCFCVFTNGSKILDTTNTREGELLYIHGIRFLSMFWILAGHTVYFQLRMKNFVFKTDYLNTFLAPIIEQSHLPVDSFFVLSGFLLTHIVMKDIAKFNSLKAWLYLCIKRYIGLTPVYMIIVGFCATIYMHLGSGPYWSEQDIGKNCQDYWWHNLLYINNFDEVHNQCMGWTWYLANDMQFFVISPLFLIALWRNPKVGYFLIAISMLACCLSNFFIIYNFKLMAGGYTGSQLKESAAKFMDYFNKIYTKPYNRINPYLIGMLTAYILCNRKRNNSSRHSQVFMFIGWMVSIGIGFTCVFILYQRKPNLISNCFYNAFSRAGYSLSLSWIIYACQIGQGGFVNSILSCKAFIPLSRLSYLFFLIHPLILSGYFNSMKTVLEFDKLTSVYLGGGFLVVCYALSLPIGLMLLSPVIELEKWIQKRFST